MIDRIMRAIRLDWTVHEFFYALARLGGHQNRKSDEEPGWLVLPDTSAYKNDFFK